MGRREKEGGGKRVRAGGDRGVRGLAGGVCGRVHGREWWCASGASGPEREEKERERFAAVGRDTSRWMGNGWDVL